MRRIFRRKEKPGFVGEEYIEVSLSSEERKKGKVGIVIERVTDFSETDNILKRIREGKIIFLNIKALRERDLEELKRVIEKIKRTVIAHNGSIVGIEDNWVLIIPEHAEIHK